MFGENVRQAYVDFRSQADLLEVCGITSMLPENINQEMVDVILEKNNVKLDDVELFAKVQKDQVMQMVEGYLEAAIFADLPEEYIGDFSANDFSRQVGVMSALDIDEFMLEMEKHALAIDSGVDAMSLLERHYTGDKLNAIGADIWLTRQGHGSGFWNRGHDEALTHATKIANEMGVIDLYVDEDGQSVHIDNYERDGIFLSKGKVKGKITEIKENERNGFDVLLKSVDGKTYQAIVANGNDFAVGDRGVFEVDWRQNEILDHSNAQSYVFVLNKTRELAIDR